MSERRRDCILDAARTVFSRKDYAATAVEDIAEQARIAKGTLYLYFRSKEDIYLAALARDVRELAVQARREMERAGTLRRKLRAFFRARLEYSKKHEDFLRIYLAEYGSMFVKSPLRKELCNLSRENMRYIATVVEEAARRGEIRRVPSGATAALIFDVARGLLERRLLGWKEFQTRNEIEFAVDLICSGIERSPAAPKRKGALKRK
ncbi:MAG TPA: helix-turn-helix domain-containing protein [Bryobacteraceae bacterium]|nr:helix-turn-helix domain-containing protein [Bryobacteraceae bacterium]